MKETLTMIVAGILRGKNFADEVKFTLFPPKGRDYYGNGYYMSVYNGKSEHYIDCRFMNTTDIEKLARIWIKDYYGPFAKEIRKVG